MEIYKIEARNHVLMLQILVSVPKDFLFDFRLTKDSSQRALHLRSFAPNARIAVILKANQ